MSHFQSSGLIMAACSFLVGLQPVDRYLMGFSKMGFFFFCIAIVGLWPRYIDLYFQKLLCSPIFFLSNLSLFR